MNSDFLDDITIVKLQSDQFIIAPISSAADFDHGCNQNVDLARQTCNCKDFQKNRVRFPIGDLRRFCSHLVIARSQNCQDLPEFLAALIDARRSNNSGMPDGGSFGFLEVDGRPCFYGDQRDGKTYFFLAGSNSRVFHDFVYDRSKKSWLKERPENGDRLLQFAFKDRSKYVTTSDKLPRKGKRRQIRKKQTDSDTPNPLSVFLAFLVIAALCYGGYTLYQKGTPNWLVKNTNQETSGKVETTSGQVPSKQEAISKLKLGASSQRKQTTQSQPPPDDSDQQETTNDSDPQGSSPSTVVPQLEPTTEGKPDHYRTWTTSDSKFSVSAKFVAYQNGTVTLEREDDERRIKIQESQLSDEDQEFLKQLRRERRLQRARDRKRESSRKNQ